MFKLTTTAALVGAVLSGASYAGGLDNSGQDISVIFSENDHQFELGYRASDPEISGTFAAANLASGDMMDDSSSLTLGVKAHYTDNIDFGFTFNQPYSAATNYSATAAWPIAGSSATVDSSEVTALARYKFGNGFSVHGGVKQQTIEAKLEKKAVASHPIFGALAFDYQYELEKSSEIGTVVGAAYERPDIALRVAVTLHSAIDHKVDVNEAHTTTSILGAPSYTLKSSQTLTTPQAINIDFQTGIAANTLLFGTIRQANWGDANVPSKLHASPTTSGVIPAADALTLGSPMMGGAISDFEDTTTYSVGIGRKLNDQWSVAATLGYEAEQDKEYADNLSPTNGYTSVGLGASYTHGDFKFSGGVAQVEIGDAKTDLTAFKSDFSDNSATVVGFKVAYGF